MRAEPLVPYSVVIVSESSHLLGDARPVSFQFQQDIRSMALQPDAVLRCVVYMLLDGVQQPWNTAEAPHDVRSIVLSGCLLLPHRRKYSTPCQE